MLYLLILIMIYKKRQKTKNPNLKLFKLLNDEIFWFKFTNVCLSEKRVRLLREYRTKFFIPSRTVLIRFIEEDYKYITGDTRGNKDIIIELLTDENNIN